MQNNEPTFDELIGNVYQWAKEKDLLKPENAPKQFMKCIEEFGETASAINKRHYDQIKDGVGDTFVTVIILCLQLGLTPQEALASAWDEIKNRKGITKDGVFVKDEDTAKN
jgi:NTP pyrophosphatase (non-canonical NTP hydrolase)